LGERPRQPEGGIHSVGSFVTYQVNLIVTAPGSFSEPVANGFR